MWYQDPSKHVCFLLFCFLPVMENLRWFVYDTRLIVYFTHFTHLIEFVHIVGQTSPRELPIKMCVVCQNEWHDSFHFCIISIYTISSCFLGNLQLSIDSVEILHNLSLTMKSEHTTKKSKIQDIFVKNISFYNFIHLELVFFFLIIFIFKEFTQERSRQASPSILWLLLPNWATCREQENSWFSSGAPW